uniref:Olfactory receptor 4F21-like n=1 Tax=Nannospalax galili TaxID=1026970 RepID=A0A8C6RHB7_NANGA
MDGGNHSVVFEFVFLGLTHSWMLQLLLLVFFSVLYMASLSFIDLGACSVTSPKMVYDLFRKHKVISFGGCVTQIFFIHVIGRVEMVLLMAMAFDRYVAIYKPLHYLTIMSPRVCVLFLAAAWGLGIIHSLFQLAFLINLPFCGPNVLDSFYCDLPRLLRLACTDTYKLQFMVIVNSGFICVGSFFVLLISYIFILFTVWKHSSGGSAKALSTLSAHGTVVCFFFGPTLFIYTWPHPHSQMDKFLALSDAVLTPFLNPVIYTFRNKEMKAAIKKVFKTLLVMRKSS